ncbi:MAG TPA: acetyl-CoA carboxylase biotin carboxyl carrier protein [Bacteroidota bacterium]|jgi:acetyl-CoA carboxylase biotin carboxyl carrier protein|nr:acetyl-CoA carboxylase biotin carboxyl carrier protein [Bacteroidota bacterium]
MDLSYLKKVLKIVNDNDINELEISEGETKIRIVKNVNHNGLPVTHPLSLHPNISIPYSQSTGHIDIKLEDKPDDRDGDQKYYEVRSPIVGTFYASPSPDADPYVKVGQKVTPGTVLCIVEAMKLMNEIESEVSGTIIKVCVENAQPVEYDQVLFLIEVDK